MWIDGSWVDVSCGVWPWLSQTLSSLLQMSLTSHSILELAQAAAARCKFILPAIPPLLTTWEWGVASVNNILYGCTPIAWDSYPWPTLWETLSDQFHTALGSSYTSLWQARHCGYDSVLELHGVDVGPVARQGCAADRPCTFWIS